MTNIADEQCVQATTWKRDGTPVMTVIWPITWGDDGTKVAFLTPIPSGKAKRLRHTPRVKLQPSDWDGFPIQGRPPVEGSVELVEGEERDRVFAAIVAKYGQDAWDAAMGRGREYFASRGIEYTGDYAVIVTPDA